MTEQIEQEERVLIGDVQVPSQREKVFVGKDAYNEALHWLEFARPRAFQMTCGNVSDTGEFGVKVVYNTLRA